jgi:hypothetical protein
MGTPMTDANVAIINELKKFINTVSNDKALRACYCYTPQSFIRNRVLTFSNTVMLITNSLKRSLQVELQSFFEYFSPGLSCSKQAFCEQRVKLKPQFFHDLNQVLVSEFYRSYAGKVKRWKNMELYAVDGSSVPLPATGDMRSTFGVVRNHCGEQEGATARICVLYDVLNEIAVKGFLHPFTVSEEAVVPECLSGISLDTKLLLFDRGYPSYWLMYLLMEKGAKFVMRMASNANNAVKDFLASSETDRTIDWRIPYKSLKRLVDMGFAVSKESTVKIRMVKVLLSTGETEVLVTNLYDTGNYTKGDLKEVYNLRWGIETYYGYMKEELQLGQFSGIRQICIEQDFAANLFLFNLQSLIEKQTDSYVKTISKRRKHRYKVNKNCAWASLKNRTIDLFTHQDARTVLIELEKLFGNYLEPIRPGRKYPRIKKRKPNVKYNTLTNYKRAL